MGSDLPAPFGERLRGRVPEEPYRFLAGDAPFADVREAIHWLSVYPALLDLCGLRSPQAHQDFLQRARTVHQSPTSQALAAWFMGHFPIRAASLVPTVFAPLLRRGLTLPDLAEILLFVAMSPFTSAPPAAHPPEDAEAPDPAAVDQVNASADSAFPDSEILRLACDPRIQGSELKCVLKHALPDEFDFFIRIQARLAGYPPNPVAYRALLGMERSLRREWTTSAHQQRTRCGWFQRGHGMFAPNGSRTLRDRQRDRLPLCQRIRLTRKGLELCFLKRRKPVWYRVQASDGRIVALDPMSHPTCEVHFALQRVGHAASQRRRGRRDILLAWMANALRSRPALCCGDRETLRQLADGYSERFMAHCDPEALRLARNLSRRAGAAWIMYGIICRHGPQSLEVSRLREFAATFPALMRVVPPAFLRDVVAPGMPLRKAIPYWNPAFRTAAQTAVTTYEQARTGLLDAALKTIGVAADNLQNAGFRKYVAAFGFRLFMAPEERHKEAFFRLLARASAKHEPAWADVQYLFAYVVRSHHVCTSNTGFAGLRRRAEAWWQAHRQSRQRANPKAGNRPFPAAWLSEESVVDDRRIVYLRDPAALARHGEHQCNCATDFCPKIRSGLVQLYALREQETGTTIGTIEVRQTADSGVELGAYLGQGNDPLDEHDRILVHAWFVRSTAWHRPKPVRQQTPKPSAAMLFT